MSKQAAETNPKLTREVAEDESDKTVKDLLLLLDYACVRTSGSTQLADHLRGTTELGQNVDDVDEGGGYTRGLPPVDEVEGATDEASKMEEPYTEAELQNTFKEVSANSRA